MTLQLCNGNRVNGATVTSSRARVYSDKLVGLPTEDSETVYFYAPESEPQLAAALLVVGGAGLYFGTLYVLGMRVQELRVRPVAMPRPPAPAGD